MRLRAGILLIILLIVPPYVYSLSPDLAGRMEDALENFEGDRFIRLLVLADVHPSNSDRRVLTNEYLASNDEFAVFAQSIAGGGGSQGTQARSTREDEFMKKFDDLSSRAEKSELENKLVSGTYELLNSIEVNQQADKLAALQKLARIFVKDHPWEASILTKELPNFQVGRIFRVLRGEGELYTTYLEAIKSDEYSEFWGDSQRDMIRAIIVILLVVIIVAVIAVKLS